MLMSKTINNFERIGSLKKSIKDKGYIRIIEAHNGLSALIANSIQVTTSDKQQRMFDGFWESSLTDSSSKGLPDIELVSFDSRLDTLNQIMDITTKPVIFDGDTGGDVPKFVYMIKKLQRAGVSMVIIEDKVYPKRNSLSNASHELESITKFTEKIRQGIRARNNPDFMIVARLESLIAGETIKEALIRAKAYLKAGADGIMIHSKSANPSQILEFAKQYHTLPKKLIKDKILVSVPTTYNVITAEKLANAGFHIIIYANHQLRAAYQAMEEVCKSILIHDRTLESESLCITTNMLFEKVGFNEIVAMDKILAQKKLQ